MKNITVSVDDETYRKARIAAASKDTSVSALVREFLTGLSADDSEFETLRKREQEVRGAIKSFKGGDRLTRDDAHRRRG